MGSRAKLGPRGRLSIPSGAVGPRRARAEAGAAPSEARTLTLSPPPCGGDNPRSAPAVEETAAEDKAGGVSGGAGPAPARGKVLRSHWQAREGWGRAHPARPAAHTPTPRPSRECKPARPPPRPPPAPRVAPSPLPAATRRCGPPPGRRSGGRASART